MFDPHHFCHECQEMLNEVMHKCKQVNGRWYHNKCWDKKVQAIEARHKRLQGSDY